MTNTIKAGQKLRITSGFRSYHGFRTDDIVETTIEASAEGFVTAKGTISWDDRSEVVGSQTLKPEHYEVVVSVDFTKPVQTRDGRPVTIVTTEGRGPYPVLAYIDGNESISTFTSAGAYYAGEEDEADIVNVPPKKVEAVRYVNLFDDGTTSMFVQDSRAEADRTAEGQLARRVRVGVAKVVLVEGQFDE